MAKKEETADINERVRGSLRTLVRNLVLVAAVVALAWVGYMLFYGTDLRRELETVEQTLITGPGDSLSYTEYIAPYVGQGATRPSIRDLDYFLTFFDDHSKDFFRENARAMARLQYQFQPDQFDRLSSDEIKVAAMQNVINRPPLSGIGNVIAQHPQEDGTIRVTVTGRDGRRYQVPMEETGGLWRMKFLGGLQSQIEGDIAGFKEQEE